MSLHASAMGPVDKHYHNRASKVLGGHECVHASTRERKKQNMVLQVELLSVAKHPSGKFAETSADWYAISGVILITPHIGRNKRYCRIQDVFDLRSVAERVP